MISTKNATYAYVVFLIAFAAFKYLSAAPEAFSTGYAISVVILVILTGVLPYLIARHLAVAVPGTIGRWLAAIVLGTVACCLAYGVYAAVFILPAGQANLQTLMPIALRGFIAGPVIGLLAGLWAHAKAS